ncbi:MAG: tRNA (N(6)-L-threonylcarbamoyladenosine(37)-C(2))-methylthiotransferase MtaB, partial [Chloroflexota bacterium]
MATDHQTAVYIETHGCKLNQADSQALERRFAEAGYRMVDNAAQADVHVVNTCTVTHVADRKARHALSAAHRANPGTILVATGCYAQRAPRRLAQIEGVRLVLGNTQKDTLVDQVNRLVGLPEGICPPGTPVTRDAPAPGHTRATVKIQEGCNQVCAYCIVPKVRGRERSLRPDALVSQVRRLTDEGYQEVALTGTQLGAYGFDLPGVSLACLIRRLLEKTSVPRLRVSSLQPQEVSDDLLALWEDPRLCPHFHLPLQSGSAEVLKAMRRRYSPRQYVQAVETIRQRVARAAITTDIIVGFPGETTQQFQETHDLCQDVQFSGLHVFPYSPRPGTSAAHL